jgi:hypothetical protein
MELIIFGYLVSTLVVARVYRIARRGKKYRLHTSWCDFPFGCDCKGTGGSRVGPQWWRVAGVGIFWPVLLVVATVAATVYYAVAYDPPTLAQKNATLAARLDEEERHLPELGRG